MPTKNSKPLNSIPHAVRPIVMRCNTLSGENPQEYEGLLVGLIEHFKPKTVMQWLNVKKLQDLVWEQARLSRIKPGIMDSIQTEAVNSLLKSLPNETQRDLRGPELEMTMDDVAGRSFWDKDVQKEVNEAFETFNYSDDTIDAVAFIRSARPLLRLEKMQASNEARQLMVSRQLEEEKNVLQLERGASDDGTEEVWQSPPRSAA
jgi:hypothetical protein